MKFLDNVLEYIVLIEKESIPIYIEINFIRRQKIL